MDEGVQKIVETFQGELKTMESKVRRLKRDNHFLRKQILKMQKERQLNRKEGESDLGLEKCNIITSTASFSNESKGAPGRIFVTPAGSPGNTSIEGREASENELMRALEEKMKLEVAQHARKMKELESERARIKAMTKDQKSSINKANTSVNIANVSASNSLEKGGKVLVNSPLAATTSANISGNPHSLKLNDESKAELNEADQLQSPENLKPQENVKTPSRVAERIGTEEQSCDDNEMRTSFSIPNNTFCRSLFPYGSSEELLGGHYHHHNCHNIHSDPHVRTMSADISIASPDYSTQALPPSKFSSTFFSAHSEGPETAKDGDDCFSSPISKLGGYDAYIGRASPSGVLTSPKPSNTEDLIRQTTNRQEVRRKRLQQLVLLRNADSPVCDVSDAPDAASTHIPSEYLTSRAPLSVDVPALKEDSKKPHSMHSHSKDMPVAGQEARPIPGKSLAHRGGGHSSAPANPVDLPFNPNQIGTEIKEDVKNRAWYLSKVLSLSFLKTAPAHKGTDEKEGPEAPDGLPINVRSKLTAAQESTRDSLDSAKYDPSEFSDSFAFSDPESEVQSPRPQSPNSVPSPKERAPVKEEVGAVPSVFKNLNVDALQRAINDAYCFHFRSCRNEALLTVGLWSKNYPLPAFEEENTNKDLLEAFSPAHMTAASKEHEELEREVAHHSEAKAVRESAQRSSFAPSTYRADEVRVLLHAPILFSQIRSFLGVKMNDFRSALERAPWRQSLSPGKSGTTLFYFGDYVMKSVKEKEFDFLKTKFLGQYTAYVERNPHTLLPRFYALVTVKWLKLGTHRRFVLMQNVFTTRYYINRIYDVKGSSVGRTGLEGDLSSAPRTAFGALLLKDNDLPQQLIICGPYQRANLLGQMRSDTMFLQGLSIVDYSCLIGVRSRIFLREEGPNKNLILERCKRSDPLERGNTYESGEGDARLGAFQWPTHGNGNVVGVGKQPGTSFHDENSVKEHESCIAGCEGGLISLPIYSPNDDTTAREDVYYIGIIDVFQTYTPAKQLEYFAKGFFNDRKKISVIPPKEYGERLYRSVESITT